MVNRVKLTKLDGTLKQIVQAAYPSYRGRTFYLEVQDRPLNVKSYWSGGSRDYFTFVNVATMETLSVPAQSWFDRQIPGAEAVMLPDGFVCVEHSIFCGKQVGLTIHIPASMAPRMLPATVQS